jgi:hypothetical protein
MEDGIFITSLQMMMMMMMMMIQFNACFVSKETSEASRGQMTSEKGQTGKSKIR